MNEKNIFIGKNVFAPGAVPVACPQKQSRGEICPTGLHLAAIETWGVEASVRRFAEECSECVAALNRFIENRAVTCLPLASEVADVQVMLDRIRFIVEICNVNKGGPITSDTFMDWVDVKREGKLRRLKIVIEEATKQKTGFEQVMEAIS